MPDRLPPVSWRAIRHLPLPVAVVLGLGACTGGSYAAGPVAPVTSTASQGANVSLPSGDVSAGTPIRCDGRFRLPLARGVTVTARFPKTVMRTKPVFSGSVAIGNETGALRGTVNPEADVFLVEDGRAVTTPLPKDLPGMRVNVRPGQVAPLQGRAGLTPCDGDAGEYVPEGRYDVYVRVLVHRDDGSVLETFGGPWPLRVD